MTDELCRGNGDVAHYIAIIIVITVNKRNRNSMCPGRDRRRIDLRGSYNNSLERNAIIFSINRLIQYHNGRRNEIITKAIRFSHRRKDILQRIHLGSLFLMPSAIRLRGRVSHTICYCVPRLLRLVSSSL